VCLMRMSKFAKNTNIAYNLRCKLNEI
jgi:hypothetical protein